MRYKDPKERQQRLAAKLMLQHWCTQGPGRSNLSGLSYTAANKPCIPGISFSSAHAGDWVLCAAAKSIMPLGIDTEPLRAVEWPLLKDYFTAQEWARICTIDTPQAQLLYLWTRKEALLKARGTGMLGDLAIIDVCRDVVNVDGQDFYLHSLALHPERYTTLAVGTAEAAFSLQRWQPV